MVNGEMEEITALSSCFQAVAQDIKTSNSSLELVCNRAVKLANQLNSTMACLIAFSDAIQVVGDTAKWSSREVGTSLTRFCLRQRALESEVKVLTTALVEKFAGPLEKKGSEWKHRLTEIERRHQKNLKKTRAKKQQQSLATNIITEYRAGCSEILMEQRSQINTFAGLLLPVINAQIRLFEEGLHIADVKETIEQNVVATNHKLIIDTIIEDICHSDDSSWRKRLASPTRKLNKARAGCNDSSSSPSTSSMALSWNQNESAYYGTMSSVGSSRPQTLSSATADGSLTARRAPISAQTFVPPTGTPFVNSPSSEFAKPPLPRRLNEPEVYDNGNKTSVFTLSSNSMSVSSNDIHDQRRPISFNGDDSDSKRAETHSLSEQINHLVDKFNEEIHSMCDQNLALMNNGANTTVVRRLGSEPVNTPASISHTQRLSVDSIKRPDSIRPLPPQPPERRNSTISATTPMSGVAAPSIFDLRNAGLFNHQGAVNQDAMNGRARPTNDFNQAQHQFDDTQVVYRTPFSQSADASNYVNQPYNQENSGRAIFYQPPNYRPSSYNDYGSPL